MNKFRKIFDIKSFLDYLGTEVKYLNITSMIIKFFQINLANVGRVYDCECV